MLKSVARSVLSMSLLLLGLSCTSPTNVTNVDEIEESYTPLKVGILKQYFFYSDSSYQNSKIVGRATREDGQETYITEINNSLVYNATIHSEYYFIKDGYLYATSLAKRNMSENPYNESRIAKVSPKDKDSWRIYAYPRDSETTLFTAHYIGQMETPAGIFQDVFNYQFYDKMISDTANVYYAEGIGHIGTKSKHQLFLMNYAKIGDKEYGKQIPIALLPKTKL